MKDQADTSAKPRSDWELEKEANDRRPDSWINLERAKREAELAATRAPPAPPADANSAPADTRAKARAEGGTAPVITAADPSKALLAAARACVDNVNAAHAPDTASFWDHARQANR